MLSSTLKKILSLVITVSFGATGLPLLGQNNDEATEKTEEVSEAKQPKGGEPGWKPPTKKSFSKQDTIRECNKYNNKLIGYYESTYLVENCKRREVADEALLNKMTRRGKKIFTVESDTIIKIPEGEPMEGKPQGVSLSCEKLNGRYVISGASEIYLIENCKKRGFPDWETFDSHRDKRPKSKSAIIELNQKRFLELAQGEPLTSILDAAYAKDFNVEKEVDLIPLDEACRGIDGKVVSYFSKVYKIENCRKREIENPGKSPIVQRTSKILTEISSEQWLSIPNGKPL